MNPLVWRKGESLQPLARAVVVSLSVPLERAVFQSFAISLLAVMTADSVNSVTVNLLEYLVNRQLLHGQARRGTAERSVPVDRFRDQKAA